MDFHPFANDYPLMPAYELGRLEQAIKQYGFDPRFPIVRYQGKILDGRNRWQAARSAEVEPRFVDFKGTDDEARIFVQLANEERRHLAPEWLKRRREERIGRVADARRDGESLRSIAETEGVSESQVRRDLESASNGAPPGAPSPASGKVTGRDGVQQPATKPDPLKCERCNRLGQVADCNACREVREAAEKKRKAKAREKKKTEREEMRDKAGNVLPDNCRDAFADTGLPDLVNTLEQVEAMFRVEPWLDKAQKLTTHYGFILIGKFKEHIYDALHSLQLAAEALKAGLPHAVCPTCNAVDSRNNGHSCKGCRGLGFVPEHRYQELTRE